jgi:hypothetical protein
MLIFGWMTIQNVKRIRQQVNPNISQNHRHNLLMKRKDYQMITMLLIQVIIFFVCVTPAGISKAYTTLTLNQKKDELELTKENFFFQVKLKIHFLSIKFCFLGIGTYTIYQLLLCFLYLYINWYNISSGS